jgi:branched-chain amino acid transport system substrate-binding protein
LIGHGAFIFGITPSQTTSAIIRYAGGQGIRRIALVGRRSPWSTGVETSARATAGPSGAEIVASIYRTETANTGLLADVKSECGGKLPDAVLLTDGIEAVNNFAQPLSKAGIQLLGTVQWSGLDLSSVEAMKGAWYAAPNPSGFGAFSAAYQKAYGTMPGVLTGLAYDAALLAGSVAQTGIVGRDAIIASSGMRGVTGTFKFNSDGSCLRQLAILSVEPGGLRVVAPVSAA